MSQPATRIHREASEQAEGLQAPDPSGDQNALTEAVLVAAFGHTDPNAQEISALVTHKGGMGLAWVLLQFIRTGRCCLSLDNLDLSDFSLGAGKLEAVFSALPTGPSHVETLKCGVCTATTLPVFAAALKKGGAGEGALTKLKTLIAADCDLEDASLLFPSLPRSLETLELRGNRFRIASMETLSSVLEARWLPFLVSLDLSDNPLGPLGVRALAKGLAAPLQVLKLARTGVKEKGVEALAEVLKGKKVTSLLTLDLAGNKLFSAGLKPLAAAFTIPGVAPTLQTLILKDNSLTQSSDPERREHAPLNRLLPRTS
uniref:Uncharacterized protein n=1 Tax=Chromera velia CCMP2878 TaxID=1169474 RepID=A0A0G4FP79_9ALVE|eukprot:Cvel_18038.t1-p1 / transcript=Cvel_18038.t1 / gene=Cvel_18038 / organism=Chromera_velia_CCMP2878 / gene_product=Ribonuclease inhibitor, putative / transcript_product=Ribonuclease inhibitor, putative / location=Cvel_scaffold1473:14229-17240(+) / protein_length=314 / sequence_SO=supercontig / SO=protein_coding / is_pseudo=false